MTTMALSPVFHEMDDSAKMIYLSQYCTTNVVMTTMALSPVFHEIDDSAKMIYLSQYCTSINNIVSVKWSPKSNVLSIGLKFRGFLIILTNIRHAICAIQNMCNLQSKCLLALVCTAPLDTWSMKLLLLLQMC